MWLRSTPVALLHSNAAYFVHADHLDTPRVVTDQSNTIIWRWDSDPFGVTVAQEDPDGNGQSFAQNLRFPGQYFDKETNLHYNYYCDYDPQTGRYLQSDPIGLAGGINAYAYAGGSPLRFVDPFGLAVGHHIIPLEVFSSLPVPPGARDVFDRATTGPLPDDVHLYDKAHRAYTDAVRQEMNEWLSKNDPRRMTNDQAKEFIDRIVKSRDPAIRGYLDELARVQAHAKLKPRSPAWKKFCKKLGVFGVVITAGGSLLSGEVPDPGDLVCDAVWGCGEQGD